MIHDISKPGLLPDLQTAEWQRAFTRAERTKGASQTQKKTFPDWLKFLLDAFTTYSAADFHFPTPPVGMERFLNLAAPLIQSGRRQLHQNIQERIGTRATVPFDPDTIADLMFALLPDWLLTVVSRTLALEMYATKLRQGLVGQTPEERFDNFTASLRRPETAAAILSEYPVLARQMVTSINQWGHFCFDFLQQLCRDWPLLLESFCPNQSPGHLVRVEGHAGDRHRNGRTVLIAHFSSGFRLVYKPASLAVDQHFQELLSWLNSQGATPPYRPLIVLNRGSYGWLEFVEAAPCQTEAQLERFYQRQGGLLALLYLLDATDFHCENLIASGEHPVPLDLEALLHPRLNQNPQGEAALFASQAISDSVLRVGLLPERTSDHTGEGIDESGLSGGGGQLTPYPIPVWENVGRDDMRLVRRRVPAQPAQNLPTLNETAVSPIDYANQFIAGFTQIYQILQQNKQRLLAKKGPLLRFANDEIRVIFRPTASYMTLLFESFHPNLLRDAHDRESHFDHLNLGAKNDPNLVHLIPSERADLNQGDIPIFTTTPGSSEVRNSQNQPVSGMILAPSLARVKQRLRQFSSEDCRRQQWFIRASLATLASSDDPQHLPAYTLSQPYKSAGPEEFLTAARQIGDRLAELAVRGKDDALWLGLTPANGPHWNLTPQQLDMYEGLPGTILFLAYLGQATASKKYTRLAQQAYHNLRQQTAVAKSYQTSIGAFSGWGGLLYLLSHLTVLWQQPKMLNEAEEILALLPPLIEEDSALDIIGGSAGCLAGLLSLYRCYPKESVLSLARQCGERLVETAVAAPPGIGWAFAETGSMPLCGFSHGAAGMAAMLLRLAAVSQEPKFAGSAHQAIAYERSVFSDEFGNWPDFRGCMTKEAAKNWREFMCAWCHGAPGVGLGRLLVWPFLHDASTRQEIEAAVQTTLAQGFGFNHCLCHGDLGNLELLTRAADAFGRTDWQAQRDTLASAVLHSFEQHGWQCGTPLGVESPGLMTGIAGIGYGLLRLARPQTVPSVLTLEPVR